jgi:hypothetical protein
VYKISVRPIHYLQRALELSLRISDKPRISEVVIAMFDLMIESPSLAKGHLAISFRSVVQQQEGCVDQRTGSPIITKLEETLMSATTFGGKDFDPFSAEAAASRLSIHYSRVGAPSEVERVIHAYGSSFVKDGRGKKFFQRRRGPRICTTGLHSWRDPPKFTNFCKWPEGGWALGI